jgi:hypothetical protein
MRYSDYKCFRFGFDCGVAFLSIDHPPINRDLFGIYSRFGNSKSRPVTVSCLK